MPERLWDAYKTLQIMDRESHGIKCVGKLVEGQRCCYPIVNNNHHIRVLLDTIEGRLPSDAIPFLEKLAQLSLCHDLHQKQESAVLSIWEEKIESAATIYDMKLRIRQLDEANIKAKKENDDWRVRVDIMQAEVRKHQACESSLNSRISDKLEREAKTNCAELQNEYLALQSGLEAIQQQCKALTLEKDATTTRQHDAQAEIEGLRGQLTSQSASSTQLQHELETARRDSSAITLSLHEMSSSLEQRREEFEKLKISTAKRETTQPESVDSQTKPGKGLRGTEDINALQVEYQARLAKYQEENKRLKSSAAATEKALVAELDALRAVPAPTKTNRCGDVLAKLIPSVVLLTAVTMLIFLTQRTSTDLLMVGF